MLLQQKVRLTAEGEEAAPGRVRSCAHALVTGVRRLRFEKPRAAHDGPGICHDGPGILQLAYLYILSAVLLTAEALCPATGEEGLRLRKKR